MGRNYFVPGRCGLLTSDHAKQRIRGLIRALASWPDTLFNSCRDPNLNRFSEVQYSTALHVQT